MHGGRVDEDGWHSVRATGPFQGLQLGKAPLGVVRNARKAGRNKEKAKVEEAYLARASRRFA